MAADQLYVSTIQTQHAPEIINGKSTITLENETFCSVTCHCKAILSFNSGLRSQCYCFFWHLPKYEALLLTPCFKIALRNCPGLFEKWRLKWRISIHYFPFSLKFRCTDFVNTDFYTRIGEGTVYNRALAKP